MEEGLFARADVDPVFDDSRRADPMHRSRLSAPMGWLRHSTLDRDALTALVLDPAWSNVRSLAFRRGLRHRAETGGDRTDPPDSD